MNWLIQSLDTNFIWRRYMERWEGQATGETYHRFKTEVLSIMHDMENHCLRRWRKFSLTVYFDAAKIYSTRDEIGR